MPPDPARRLRIRMTLRQFGVLIIFVAITLAVLRPIGQSAAGAWEFAVLAAVELPYAILLALMILVRRGPIKLWLASALAFLPLAAWLVYINFVGATGQLTPSVNIGQFSPMILMFVAIVDVAFLPLLISLGRQLVPVLCPDCGQRAMLRDPTVPRSRDFPGSRLARSCLACGSRFRRNRRGPWVNVNLLPARPSLSDLIPKSSLQDHL